MPPVRAANATLSPSGENAGDSGSSTVFIGIRYSIFRVRTFWTISVRSFSVRTKYARRSPFGDQPIHGISNRPIWTMWSKPMSLSKPLVRSRTIEPSLAEMRTMSISWSLRLMVTAAIRSPDGEGAIESASVNFVFSRFGERSGP